MINDFRAVYCSGFMIPNQATVAALSLLFERVFLPNNVEFAIEHAKSYRLVGSDDLISKYDLVSDDPDVANPLDDLTEQQRTNALGYLEWSMVCAWKNSELFGKCFETDAFGDKAPVSVELIKEGPPGEDNEYEVRRNYLVLDTEETPKVTELISNGYVPVVGMYHCEGVVNSLDAANPTAKQLAALLALKSVEMFFPATQAVDAQTILEARERLRDHLPVFWASMFKLTSELRKLVNEDVSVEEMQRLGVDLVDTLVRPAVTDLNRKIEMERKQWFRRIFGPIYQGLKLMAATPPMNQAQLIGSAIAMSGDAAMNLSDQMQNVELLKSQVGLTYLVELGNLLTTIEAGK